MEEAEYVTINHIKSIINAGLVIPAKKPRADCNLKKKDFGALTF